MNKKKLLALLTSLTLVAAVGIGATLAYFTDSDAATNVITMGHVDIDLDEPEFDEEAGDDKTITDITPGQKITKDPTITVDEDSADAYLRATITFEGLTDGTNNTKNQISELLANINIDTEVSEASPAAWYYNSEDGYYYYNTKVSAGNSVELFTEVEIPASWGNEVADLTFKIIVSAEAIQADNFAPTLDTTGKFITAWEDANGDAITAETYTAPATVAPVVPEGDE